MIQPRTLARSGLLAASLLGPSLAFTTPLAPSRRSLAAASPSLASSASSSPDVVVISPPGGVGEIASVEAARLGGSVRWFVVSAPDAPARGGGVALSSGTLAAVAAAGGSVELAGAPADALLAPPGPGDAPGTNGALAAVADWCGGNPGSVICTYDGADAEAVRADRARAPSSLAEMDKKADPKEGERAIRDGVLVAAREAAGRSRAGRRVAVLAAGEETDYDDGEDGDEEGEGVGGLLAGLFGGDGAVEVPASMDKALGGATAVLRHGELFGAAESSPESSPFAGGPKRDPTVREMYTLRSVRVGDASAADSSSRSNRLAVAAAASRLGLGRIASAAKTQGPTAVSVSSYAGTDAPTDAEWDAEFARAAEASAARGAGTLFRAEFADVPDPERLAEWIAVKWAPAVLRSYDIAGTRVGARPVYAARDGTTVEVVWQELVDFESVTSGRMLVEVDGTGMTAKRGAGDAARGFGRISRAPLPGEDLLVRRLADAASQAVEKGLAEKPRAAKKEVEVAKPVTTLVEAAPAPPAAAAAAPAAVATGPGPRGAGARRSAQRSRGKRRKASSPPPASSDGDGES